MQNVEHVETILPSAKTKKKIKIEELNKKCSKEEIEFKRNRSHFYDSFMKEDELNAAAKNNSKKYFADVSDKFSNEAIHLRHVYDANFETRLTP